MASVSLVKIGQWRGSDDSFQPHPACPTGAVFDLNDGTTFALNDEGGYGDAIKWGPVAPKAYTSPNPRVTGSPVTKISYEENRELHITLFMGQGSAYSTWITGMRNLATLCSGITPDQPAALLLQPSGSAIPTYADVLAVKGLDMAFEELKWILLEQDHITLTFIIKPMLRGAALTLQNLIMNPGVEVPATSAVNVFTDNFANFNAYSVQAGGALTQDKYTYADAVDAINGAAGASGTTMGLQRYYRLDEASGTTTYDASGKQQNGTTHGSPTQGATGLLTGDSDTAYVFAAASSQYISTATTGLPTGNNPWTLHALFKTPAAFPGVNMEIVCYGVGVAHQEPQLYIDNTGLLHAATNSGDTTGFALTTSTTYDAAATWDGTTLTLYVNGTSRATATPTALTIPTSSTFCSIGATPAASPALFYSGTIDEVTIWSGCMTSTQVATLHTAATTSPTTTANTMLVPSGGRESFGSAAWLTSNPWQVRFRWVTGLTANFYLQYQDANNYLLAQVTGTQVAVSSMSGGASTSIGTASINLVNGVQYWLQTTLFSPTLLYFQAKLSNDVAGVVGSAIATASGTLLGVSLPATPSVPQIAASGAALGLGGNFSNVHTWNLFGPGGWYYSSSSSTLVPGAWEQTTANCYPNGAVTSNGALRWDLPSTGVGSWANADTSSAARVKATAFPATQSQLLQWSAHGYATSGANLTFNFQFAEYNTAGTLLTTVTGSNYGIAIANTWLLLSGSYTPSQATCAYAALTIIATTTGTAQKVWIDNIQVWNQTSTGITNMPYCELRFPVSPAQWLVTGIQGDFLAPSVCSVGTYFSAWPTNTTLSYYVGRRAFPGNTVLVGQGYMGAGVPTATVDTASYGGAYSTGVSLGGNATWTVNGGVGYNLATTRGTYQILTRSYSGETTGNIANVTGNFTMTQTAQSGITSSASGATLTLFTAGQTWSVVSWGSVNLPIESYSASRDISTVTAVANLTENDTTGGGSLGNVNWTVLFPVDSDTVLAQSNTSSASQGAGSGWFWLYIDGLNPYQAGLLIGQETTATPAPQRGVGGTVTGTTVSLRSTGDTIIFLDPTTTINGTTAAQGIVLITDGVAGNYGAVMEFKYVPLFWFPR